MHANLFQTLSVLVIFPKVLIVNKQAAAAAHAAAAAPSSGSGPAGACGCHLPQLHRRRCQAAASAAAAAAARVQRRHARSREQVRKVQELGVARMWHRARCRRRATELQLRPKLHSATAGLNAAASRPPTVAPARA
eukprot:365775-Chlamydomonas_euryale.AAC.15